MKKKKFLLALGENIRRVRVEKDVSMLKLGKTIKKDYRSIMKVEQGNINCTLYYSFGLFPVCRSYFVATIVNTIQIHGYFNGCWRFVREFWHEVHPASSLGFSPKVHQPEPRGRLILI